jgi:hypothetical protein
VVVVVEGEEENVILASLSVSHRMTLVVRALSLSLCVHSYH